ncbi:MAG: hypothetical protein CMD78_04400 [Gammaproteobacteria bacterium]|nr:hypothetical protein [Gammaproteobacteria bacterium]|tara:strand:- start:3660 stop:4211 length:552 start_codon:yes stop_codon:yes gene_type:complete
MQSKILNTLLLISWFLPFKLHALPEMIIGEETIDPGIHLIFECGIKDDIAPNAFFLDENETDVHIEMLANWSESAPIGSVPGGHVAYLKVSLIVKNEMTNTSVTVNLVPHLNLSDNLHYAQNIKLPGKIDDKYTLKFIIEPPVNGSLGMHYDWRQEVGKLLSSGGSFTFDSLDFSKIAIATRR